MSEPYEAIAAHQAELRKAISPMPPNVAAAISKVMAGVPKLQRGETNKHADYKFASIDDFLEAVRPLCAESGLIILQDEASSEMLDGVDKYGKPKRWLSVTYSFTLAHSSGETWAHRPTRSIIVDASMGSQAYGAAQSYTLKLFERSLFQISTGEKGQDVDEHAPVDLPSNGQRKRKSSAAAKRDGDWPKFEQALRDCQSAREVERLRAEYQRDVYSAWNADWRDVAEEAFEKRLAEFSQGEDLKQTLQDSLQGPDEDLRDDAALRDELIEDIQKMGTEADLLVWRESHASDLASLPKPMQIAVRRAGATKLETLQKAGQ